MPEVRQPYKRLGAAVESVLKFHRIRYDRGHLLDRILSHPDYPSFRGLSEILGEYGVHATWYEGDIADIRESLHPCVLLMKDGTLRVMGPSRGELVVLAALTPRWSGCFLQCVPTEYTRELRWSHDRPVRRFSFHRIVGSLPVALTVLFTWPLVASCLGADRAYWLRWTLLTAVLLGGLVVCLLMTMKRHFQLELPFCGASPNSGCAKAMDSPAAAVVGIPLADFGLVFFLGGLMAVHGSQGHLGLFRWAAIPFALSLPVSVYLMLHQKLVLKAWCVYCLVIQAFVWLASVLLFCLLRVIPPSPFALGDLVRVASCFAIAGGLVVALEHFIFPYYGQDESRLALDRLLQAPSFIESQILSGQKADPHSLDPICAFGSGGVSLTLVGSPSCAPCKSALQDAFRLLNLPGQALRLDIQFLVLDGDPSPLGDTAEYLATLRMLLDQGETAKAERAFRDCFIERSVQGDRWFSIYGNAETHHQDRVRKALRGCAAWCRDNNIQATPTIILKGHILRRPLKARHLVYWALRQNEA